MSGWTTEHTEFAIKLWKEGHSANAVARALTREFGVHRSRNAVIGRLNRLGHARPAPTSPATYKPAKPKRALNVLLKRPTIKVEREPKPTRAPVVIADVSNAKPWTERGFGECAFPLGEKGAVMSCCAPTAETYCPAHRVVMGGKRVAWSPKDMRRIERFAA